MWKEPVSARSIGLALRLLMLREWLVFCGAVFHPAGRVLSTRRNTSCSLTIGKIRQRGMAWRFRQATLVGDPRSVRAFWTPVVVEKIPGCQTGRVWGPVAGERAWCCAIIVGGSADREGRAIETGQGSPQSLLRDQNSYSRIIMGRQGIWRMCDLNSPGNAHQSVWGENMGTCLSPFIPTSLRTIKAHVR